MPVPPIVSSTGIIHVLGFTPTEGERGVPISVRIHFHPDLADALAVRLVVGQKAVPTNVSLLPGHSYGRWQLDAAAPPFDALHADDHKLLLSVQALNDDNDILDTVTFGEFSYWEQGTALRRPSVSAQKNLPRLQIPQTSATTSLRRRSSHLPTPSPTSSHPESPEQPKARLHRRPKAPALARTRPNDDAYAQTPMLDLVTPLRPLCDNWTPAERAAGRRLVRFDKVQDGRRLIVSCEPVPQDRYRDTDTVVSCIRGADSTAYYVTSVDVIYLLERLTGNNFPVEEKNRIRRNLEGLRPTTISKHKPGFSEFFQQIMDFPDPKPRNIEKDLKVFDWTLLDQALDKILTKYSIYTPSAPEQDATPPALSPSSAGAGNPELSYPDDAAAPSRFLDQNLAAHARRYAPYALAAADYPSMPSARPTSGADMLGPAFASPVDSLLTASSSGSSGSAFPLFKAHTHMQYERDAGAAAPRVQMHEDGAPLSAGIGPGGMGEAPHPWGAMPYKSPGELEHYNILATYDVVEPGAHNNGGGGGGIHAPYGMLSAGGMTHGGHDSHGGYGAHDVHDVHNNAMGAMGGGGAGEGAMDPYALFDGFTYPDEELANLQYM